MNAKLKEAALWVMAIFFSTAIVAMFWAVSQIVETIAMEYGVLTNSISINYCPMCGRKFNDR